MRLGASWNQLAVWVITVVANQYSVSNSFLALMAIFTKAKEFKGVKQQLKVFCLRLRQFDVSYRTRLQNKRLTTVKAS